MTDAYNHLKSTIAKTADYLEGIQREREAVKRAQIVAERNRIQRQAADILEQIRALTVIVNDLPGVIKALDEEAKKLDIKYDPDQPRDEAGRWTDTGGGGGDGGDSGGRDGGGISSNERLKDKVLSTAEKLGLPPDQIGFTEVNIEGYGNVIAGYSSNGKIDVDLNNGKLTEDNVEAILSHEIEHKNYIEVFNPAVRSELDEIEQHVRNGDEGYDELGLISEDYSDYPAIQAARNITDAVNSDTPLTPYADLFTSGQYRGKSAMGVDLGMTESMSEVASLLASNQPVPEVWLKAYNSYRSVVNENISR